MYRVVTAVDDMFDEAIARSGPAQCSSPSVNLRLPFMLEDRQSATRKQTLRRVPEDRKWEVSKLEEFTLEDLLDRPRQKPDSLPRELLCPRKVLYQIMSMSSPHMAPPHTRPAPLLPIPSYPFQTDIPLHHRLHERNDDPPLPARSQDGGNPSP